jgi:DNA-binding IclR family transcriptional regulator
MARPCSRAAEPDKQGDQSGSTFVVRALAKGLTVLGLFDAENREWTLDEIAERAGLPRMTAYRMIRTMESAGYLVRDPVTSRYHLGPALLAATYLSESYADLVKIARPYLEELTAKTGEAATLAVEVGGVAVSVYMVNAPRPLRREVAVGRIIGDTANANGKIFAAFKSKEELADLLAQPRTRLTPSTIIEPQKLEEELERVRREGVAFDNEERNVGTCAVGAPVRDQLGKVIAAVSLVAPTGRFQAADRQRYAEAIRETAGALSAFLGYSTREGAI